MRTPSPQTSLLRSATGAALLGAALLVGCGSEPEFAESPTPSATPPAASTPAPTAAAPAPTATAAPAVTAGPCDANQALALTTTLNGRTAKQAAGMVAEGAPACGVVAEGQTVSSATVGLKQNVCYAVLAHALPDVTEVEVTLEVDQTAAGIPPALQPIIPKVLAVGTTTGQEAQIGANGVCYKNVWPVEVQAKLVVKAKKGGGPVAAQLYRKK